MHNNDLDFAFTCKEVREGIKRLKKNKQPGIDLIHNEFIIVGKEILLLPIVNLFNRVLSTGIFPDTWNLSCISFLHTNGDICNCDNYICLSLTNCIGKYVFHSFRGDFIPIWNIKNYIISFSQDSDQITEQQIIFLQ